VLPSRPGLKTCERCRINRMTKIPAEGYCRHHPSILLLSGKRKCYRCYEYQKEKEDKQVKQGFCRTHPKNPCRKGFRNCQDCYEKDRNRYQSALSKGYCPAHSSVALLRGKKRCHECVKVRKRWLESGGGVMDPGKRALRDA
jgi:hypothetical protein